MSNVLKKITTEAKRIRKQSPRKTWKAAVKEAGAKYRSGAIKGTPKRKSASKKPVRRLSGVTVKPRVAVATNIGSVTAAKSQVRAYYRTELGTLLMKRELTTGIRDRKQLSKKIAEVKKTLTHFS